MCTATLFNVACCSLNGPLESLGFRGQGLGFGNQWVERWGLGSMLFLERIACLVCGSEL